MTLKKKLLAAAAIVLALLVALLTYVAGFKPKAHYFSVADIDAMGQRSNGLTDCFWIGIVAKGTGANYAYPDTGANYWITQFKLPPGASIAFDGEYPHARHMSFNSYDELGQPVDRLNDTNLVPEAGSINPFLPGAMRDQPERKYKMHIAQAAIVAGTPMAQIDAQRVKNTVYVPQGDNPAQLLMRVYVQDKGLSAKGGVELPQPTVHLADGKTLQGEALCRAIVIKEKSLRDIHLTKEATQTLLALHSNTTAHHPAQAEPNWIGFLNPQMIFAAMLNGTNFEWVQKLINKTRKGGFYSTLDNTYMFANVDKRLGEVLVLHGKAPTTPKTFNGDAVMQAAQLRYWSFCKNRSLYDTAVDSCVYDEQAPLDAKGHYTIVFSAPEHRPANATEACGVVWRPWGVGDGLDNPDGGLLIYRHMMAAPDFGQSIFATRAPGDEKATLGPYYPTSSYQSKADFEKRGCAKT